MAKKFLSDIELDAGLVDVNGNTGTSGQILSSTGTGVSWVSNASISEASESVHITVKNTSGATITKGTPVYVTGETGNSGKIEIAPADANDVNKMPALGLLESNLADNAEGFCVQGGLLEGLSTATIDGTSTTANDTVYIKAGGGLTMTKPTGTNFIQNIAKVARVHASNGSLVVSSILRTNDVPTPLYIDHANQRVGIGEETPLADLHISKDSTGPELRLSHEPASGFGGGGSIRFQGGSTDYVYGSINFYNGANRDAQLYYAAAGRNMNFQVNERSIATNGYFRFYSGGSKIAEISPLGVYGNVFYDQGDTNYYLNPAGSSSLNTINVTTINRNPVVTLSGDVSGSATMTNLGSINITTTVANNSHQHNVLYENSTITYGASQLQWMDISGNGGTGLNGNNPQNPTNDWHHHLLMNHGNALGYYVDLAFDFHDDNVWFQRNEAGTLQGWRQMFHDGYHPNADTWTTARTITIGNTGKSVNGSSNVSWSLSEIGIASTELVKNYQNVNYVASDPTASGSRTNYGIGVTVYEGFNAGTNRPHTYDATVQFMPTGGQGFELSANWVGTTSTPLKIRSLRDTGQGWSPWVDVAVSGTTSSGTFSTTGDYRAPIFFDSDNTSYWVNPAQTSNFHELEILRNSSNYTVNLTDAHDRAGLMIKSSTNFDSKLAFSSGANSIQIIQALNNAHTTGRNIAINPFGGDVGIGTTSPNANLHISSGTANEDCVVIIESDTDNNDETSNPRLELRQDGGGVIGRLGYRDNTNSLELINEYAEALYLGTSNTTDLTILSNGKVGIGTTGPNQKLTIKGTDEYVAAEQTNYVWGATGTIGVRMGTDATAGLLDFRRWIGSATTHGTALITQKNADGGYGLDFRVDTKTSNTVATTSRMFLSQSGEVGIGTTSPGQKLHVIGNVAADVFYDRLNTAYFFNGDASKDGVDLVTSGNYAINVLGTISGGHRKHGNLETPEMEWSIGGSTDLNWKKLCDVVINDASYSGFGAEIEITNFSGNYGNAIYNGGEFYRGALSVYHWGGAGDETETAHASVPYDIRGLVRWYKIEETGKNRYELQVKSPANYQQLHVKVKAGIGNQVADIISYANDTNGTTSGGTEYIANVNGDFNHEFNGDIWTNESKSIGFKNAFGNPSINAYYGAIWTSNSLYVGSPTSGNGQSVTGLKFTTKSNSSYYFDGGNTGDSIRVAGDVVAYYSSDKRYKQNISTIKNSLDKVNSIRGVSFEWNELSHKKTGKKDIGVIAQEVEKIFPEIVETRENGYKAVDYPKLTAVLIESIKELTAKVKDLEDKQK